MTEGHFLIQVSSGEDSYVMFDDTVQLGMPEADAWIDDQEKLHMVIGMCGLPDTE